jgi:hypothetical protein
MSYRLTLRYERSSLSGMDVGQGTVSAFDRFRFRDAHFFRSALVETGFVALLDDMGLLPGVLLRFLRYRKVHRSRVSVLWVDLLLPLSAEKAAGERRSRD